MSFKIEYFEEGNIVYVKINARVDFATARKYSTEARNNARDTKSAIFLIDHSKTTLAEGINKIYTDGAVLEQFGFWDGDKIAIIVDYNDNDIILGKIHTGNVKWSNCRYFKDKRGAINWSGEEDMK